MLKQLAAWWSRPSVAELENAEYRNDLERMSNLILEHQRTIRDLNDDVERLKTKLEDRIKYIAFIESELKRLQPVEDVDDYDYEEICDECERPIEDCDCDDDPSVDFCENCDGDGCDLCEDDEMFDDEDDDL